MRLVHYLIWLVGLFGGYINGLFAVRAQRAHLSPIVLSQAKAAVCVGRTRKRQSIVPLQHTRRYCDRLVQDYRLKYLAVKDIVQFETNRNSPYSREIKSCMSKGTS